MIVSIYTWIEFKVSYVSGWYTVAKAVSCGHLHLQIWQPSSTLSSGKSFYPQMRGLWGWFMSPKEEGKRKQVFCVSQVCFYLKNWVGQLLYSLYDRSRNCYTSLYIQVHVCKCLCYYLSHCMRNEVTTMKERIFCISR